jgi:TolB-like protein
MKQPFAHAKGIAALGATILLLLTSFLPCCAGGGKSQSEFPPDREIKTLLVVPFQNQSLLKGENTTYRCNLCGGMFTTSRVEKGAETFVTDAIVSILGERKTITIIPNDRVNSIRKKIMLRDESKPSDLSILIEIGRELGADAVLTGSVYKFRQRVGSNFAADSPASVGLDIDLIHTETGHLIWHSRFDETQEYLTNNFLKIVSFFKRGGKWITAEKLTTSGLKDLLEGSPIP